MENWTINLQISDRAGECCTYIYKSNLFFQFVPVEFYWEFIYIHSKITNGKQANIFVHTNQLIYTQLTRQTDICLLNLHSIKRKFIRIIVLINLISIAPHAHIYIKLTISRKFVLRKLTNSPDRKNSYLGKSDRGNWEEIEKATNSQRARETCGRGNGHLQNCRPGQTDRHKSRKGRWESNDLLVLVREALPRPLNTHIERGRDTETSWAFMVLLLVSNRKTCSVNQRRASGPVLRYQCGMWTTKYPSVITSIS